MTLSSQKPQRRTDVYDARRARHHGLRAVASALGLRDFVELRRPRRRKRESARPWIDGMKPAKDLKGRAVRVEHHLPACLPAGQRGPCGAKAHPQTS
jgi:hypothetical protein